MNDLRSELIEVIAKAIWNVPRGSIHRDAAELALDATLAFLTAHVLEWGEAADGLGQIVWLADRDPEPADWLLAALRAPVSA